jgi:hypothetical protein
MNGDPKRRRPGGFLSSNAPGGFPTERAFKSYYPPTVAPYNRIDGDTRQQGFVKGHNAGLKEILQLVRLSPKGKPRKIIGLPTGRRYIDQKFHGVRDVYKNNEFDRHYNLTRNLDRDDYEKTFNKYKGFTKMTPEGGRKKTVETGGENLNWLQRRFPGVFTERYKTKSKYGPEGELTKRVTKSREGGREVKKYPTKSALDAMIALDIIAAQGRNGK